MRRRPPAALACALLLALLPAACGEEGDTTTTQTDPAPGAPSPRPERQTGEQSVEAFGREAKGPQREAILAAERGYLTALAEREHAAACAYLTDAVRASLRQLVVGGLKARGCPAILPEVLSPAAFALARAQAGGELRRVRVGDGQAFAIFRAPGAKLWVLPMRRQGGQWRPTTLLPSVLVPDLEGLG